MQGNSCIVEVLNLIVILRAQTWGLEERRGGGKGGSEGESEGGGLVTKIDNGGSQVAS